MEEKLRKMVIMVTRSYNRKVVTISIVMREKELSKWFSKEVVINRRNRRFTPKMKERRKEERGNSARINVGNKVKKEICANEGKITKKWTSGYKEETFKKWY